ncbi:ran-binding protein 1 homolog a-like isoform X1 [Phoenix dactylifera]|uniref:Ran-binding protein 1 homolog a-like isoform X1 n=1 Tax=Phoenix dactylifera TaxID=42345 RepID=A0A8B7CRW8_PHODC|nr:ran-binding protein 1 homolog a-like isoform X1 [Phoenix dactylifera]
MASADPERRDEVEAGEVAGGEEEDTGAQIAPIIRLEEVAVTTGEEEEDVLLDLKAKLYRFDKEGKQWKERGTGNVKLLKHKESGKVRLVMRQAKTLKICANHLVLPSIKMQEHVGNDKSCVWHAVDFSEGELKEEMFCIRLGSVENCKKFKEKVEGVAESLGKNEERESKDVSATAGLVEKLSVGESTSEVTNSASAPAETAEPASTADVKKDETEA